MATRAVLLYIPILLAVAGLVMVPACGGGGGAAPVEVNQPGAESMQPQVQVPFPGGEAPLRTGSAIQLRSSLGKDAGNSGIISTDPGSSSFAMPNGNDMLLVAYPDDYAFAVYELNAGAFQFSAIHYQMTIADPQKTWLGVADYDAGRWRWQRFQPGAGMVDTSGFNATGPNGNAYLAVLAGPDTSVTVEEVWLEVDVPEWTIAPAQLSPGMGSVHALALVDGAPALVAQQYSGPGAYDTKYLYSIAQLPSGPSDWVPSDIQTGLAAPLDAVALVEQAGQVPGFAVIYSDTQQLWYNYANNSVPASGDWNFSFVANVYSPELDMALVDGSPGIVYENLSMHGGTKAVYAWTTSAIPTSLDWDYWFAAETMDGTQDYEGLALCAVQGATPALLFYDRRSHYLDCFTAAVAQITDPAQTQVTHVDDPPLGGIVKDITEWNNGLAVVYDSVNSMYPRFAYTSNLHPDAPENFTAQHQLFYGSAYSIRTAVVGGELGAAWRDAATGAVYYAWLSGVPLDGGSAADWRVVQVEERATEGSLCLIETAGVACISYYTTIDEMLYIARVAPMP